MPCSTSPCSGDWTFTRAYESPEGFVTSAFRGLNKPVDGVGDGAGEAAVLRCPKGLFHHLARFPDSFTGMASMRTFGRKRCYRTCNDDSKGKSTAGAVAGSLGCQQRDCGGAIRAGVRCMAGKSSVCRTCHRYRSCQDFLVESAYCGSD